MKLILVRHGECERLTDGVYNGWEDYPLTDKGKKQAKNVGNILKNRRIIIDIAYTSLLSRTIDTANIILDTVKIKNIDVISTYLLNERHYGVFQGKSKQQVIDNEKYIKIYNSLYDGKTKPPKISDEEFEILVQRYAKILKQPESRIKDFIPRSESLDDVLKRIDIFFERFLKLYIKKNINNDKTIMIVSHSNPLKMIVKKIEGIPTYDKAIKNLFATCGVYIYDLDDESFLNSEYIINSKKVLNNNWYA